MAWGGEAEWRARREKLLARYSRMSDAALRAEYKRLQGKAKVSVATGTSRADLAGYLATQQTHLEWTGRAEPVRARKASGPVKSAGGHTAGGENVDPLAGASMAYLRSIAPPGVKGRSKAELIKRIRDYDATTSGTSAHPTPARASGPRKGVKTRPVYQARRDFQRRKVEGKFQTQIRQAPATRPLKPSTTRPLPASARIREHEAAQAETERTKIAAKTGKRRAPKTKPLSNRGVYASGPQGKANPRYRPESPSTRPVYRASDLKKGPKGHLYVRSAPVTLPGANRATPPHGETPGRKVARAQPSVRTRAAVASVPPRRLTPSEGRGRLNEKARAAGENASHAGRIPYLYARTGSRRFPEAVRRIPVDDKQDILEEWRRQGHYRARGAPTSMTDEQATAAILRHVATCSECRKAPPKG